MLIASGAAAASLLLGACSPSGEMPNPTITSALGIEACVDGPTRNSVISAIDRQPLPALGNAPYNPQVTSTKKIGALSIRHNQPVLTATSLPEAYQTSLIDATHDPYVGCLLAKHVKAANVLTIHEGPDGGAYVSNNDAPDYDNINLTLTDTPDRRGRYFFGRGSLRAVLAHEGTHALFEEWDTSINSPSESDPEGKELLTVLNDAYRTDMLQVYESYRKQYGPEVVKQLDELSKQYTKAPNVLEAISYVMESFGEKDGLQDLALYNYHSSSTQFSRNSVEDMVWQAAEDLGLEFNIPSFKLPGFSKLNKELQGYLETQFPASDESTTLQPISGGGHPYDNADELLASTVASDQLNPEATVRAIRALPPARRQAAIRQREAMVGLFKHFDPELVEYLQTPKVLEQL